MVSEMEETMADVTGENGDNAESLRAALRPHVKYGVVRAVVSLKDDAAREDIGDIARSLVELAASWAQRPLEIVRVVALAKSFSVVGDIEAIVELAGDKNITAVTPSEIESIGIFPV
jgi:hypothetical protein